MYIQVVRPRVAWVKPLPYEVNIDEAKDIIEALVNEPIDPKLPVFGTYEEAKSRIELNIKIPQAINIGKKRVAKLETVEGPPIIIKVKGKDEEDEPEDDEEESEKEEEPERKKGKVIITKPQKPTTAVFTRRSKKGKKESEVVFV